MPETKDDDRELERLVEDAAEGLWERLRDAMRLARKLEGFVF